MKILHSRYYLVLYSVVTTTVVVHLAADAAENGDFTFSNLISSIQTDESRHAQIGGAALKVLLENGKKEEAQSEEG